MPRTDDELHHFAARVLRLDGLVHGRCAVDVFLVPQRMHDHDGDLQRLLSEHSVDRLVAPESVVCGMLDDLLPETELFHPIAARQLAGRSRTHI